MAQRISLEVPRASRVVVGVAGVFFWVVSAMVLKLTLLRPELSVDWTLAVLFGLFTGWIAVTATRLTLVAPHIELGDDRFVVVHPGLLKRPIEIPRRAVLAISVDDPEAAVRRSRRRRSPRVVFRKLLPVLFPLADDSAKQLYPGGLALMPLIGSRLQLPNVAVTFNDPLELGRVARRLTASVTENLPLHDAAATPGLFLRVTQPHLVQEVA